MAIELKLISSKKDCTKRCPVITAKVQANSVDEAIGYFKGRFGKTGELVKKVKSGVFVVRSR